VSLQQSLDAQQEKALTEQEIRNSKLINIKCEEEIDA